MNRGDNLQKSSFFNSINGDRKYKAESWAEQIASIIGNGILANPADNLRVQADSNMTVVVRAGRAWINGYFYWNTDDFFLTLPTADGVLKRIDRIVVRWDLSARDIYLAVKKGTASSNPLPPPVQRDADFYELALADITVNKGAVTITSGNIADTRYLKDVCGKVAPLFEELDLSDFYEECSRNMMRQITEWENQTSSQQSTWNTQTSQQQTLWLEKMDTYAAQIQALQSDYNSWKTTIDSWKGLTVTELAKQVSFNFDNQLAFPGTYLTSTPYANNTMTEEMRRTADNTLLAKQIFVNTPGTKTETTQYLYAENGTTVLFATKQTFTISTLRTDVIVL